MNRLPSFNLGIRKINIGIYRGIAYQHKTSAVCRVGIKGLNAFVHTSIVGIDSQERDWRQGAQTNQNIISVGQGVKYLLMSYDWKLKIIS